MSRDAKNGSSSSGWIKEKLNFTEKTKIFYQSILLQSWIQSLSLLVLSVLNMRNPNPSLFAAGKNLHPSKIITRISARFSHDHVFKTETQAGWGGTKRNQTHLWTMPEIILYRWSDIQSLTTMSRTTCEPRGLPVWCQYATVQSKTELSA